MHNTLLSTAPLWIPLAALGLDLCIGDPPRFPHPVRGIGKIAEWVERPLRRIPNEFIAGVFGLLITAACTGGATWLLLQAPSVFGLIIATYLAFAGLALGQLTREGSRALHYLDQGDIAQARIAVGGLVSRNVSNADEQELCRVLAETLSENLNDGFTAPFFWLTLGGPLGLWIYKAVSTLDSLWGYPYPPWTRFGTAAAQTDDVLAYIPARLTVVFLLLAGTVSGLQKNWPGFAAIAKDAARMKSPNAGWPMSACAWLHHAHMGGPAVYDGKVTEKPRLGPENCCWDTHKLRSLITHIRLTGLIAGGVLWLCLAVPRFFL